MVADASFNAAVDRTVAGESVGQRPIERSAPAPTRPAAARSSSSGGRTTSASNGGWPRSRGCRCWLSGSRPTAWTRGVHVNFVIQNNRVKFDVNNDNAGRAGLTISSKLLRVAHSVTSRSDQ